ncbi:putative transcription factor bHLH family [Helianthus annuus]|nr:putative transcription factor bHLH family [Helianthus annuus]KAJ0907685.1 putative transcription factor bHLH family [Helianthus annuus]
MVGAKVHWFSILNSFMVITFLAGIVLVIFLRTVRRDLTHYEELDKEAQAQMNEELSGWKLVVADVFRAPSNPGLLSVMVGNVVQILGMAVVTIMFAALGFMSPASRGTLVTGMLIFYMVLGNSADYVAVHVHIKRHLICELPETDSGIKQWCRDRFVEKLRDCTSSSIAGCCPQTKENAIAVWTSTRKRRGLKGGLFYICGANRHIEAMDMPSSWLPELEMQDQVFMNQYQMNKPYYYPMEDLSFDSFSSYSYTKAPSFINQSVQIHKCLEEPARIEQPFNYKKSDSINMISSTTEKPKGKLVSDTPNTFTISFRDIQPKDEFHSFSDTYGVKRTRSTVRNPIQVQERVLAERKRREKLAQRFMSLSSLLPDLKKTDKATVLEDAANYIKELQNRVKELEGIKKKSMQESVITGKRSRLSSSDDNVSCSNEANLEESSKPLNPEIQVSMSGCSLLVEIYCWRNNISLLKVLNELKKLGLSIISCSTVPFSDTTLLVTIVAQMNEDFVLSTADVVKNLQLVV